MIGFKRNLFLLSAMSVCACAFGQEKILTVEVENGWKNGKTDEPVVISLDGVNGLDFVVRSADVTDAKGERLAYQLDDMDGDMKADELVFLTNIGAKEKQTFKLKLSASARKENFTPRVYADIKLNDKADRYPKVTSIEIPQGSYVYSDIYHHGAAFESELTAYRIYIDERQNIDLYGKYYRRLELEKTGFYSSPELQKERYGNDVLWAGGSIGCGSFKGWNGKTPVNLDSVAVRGQRIIASGPLRTVVEVKDMGWQYGDGEPLNMKEYLIQYAGHRECEVSVTFDAPLGNQVFCTGVQKVGATPKGTVRKDGLAYSWGSDYPDMGMKDQYPPEAIGLGVYVPEEYIKKTVEDDLNYLFVVGAEGKTAMKYYVTFCADKEKDGFHSAEAWFGSMDSWKDGLDHPVEVRLK